MRIREAVAATHPGKMREHNEDAVLRVARIPLFAVADGMGGPGAGDVAAALAINTVKRYAESLQQRNEKVAADRSTANRLALGNLLDEVLNQAGREIHAEATRISRIGMAATMVLATIVRNYAYIAHVGDTRAYLFREGRLIRLTEDHSVAEFRFRRGKITREEYEQSPDRHVLYQALGAGVEVDVDLAQVRLVGGDVLFLCSDGLPRALSEPEMAECVVPTDLATSLRKMVGLANRAGAPDNVTAVLVSVDADNEDEPIEAITDVMRQVFLFAELSEQERLVIAPYLEEVVYEKGAQITNEGDPSDTFYVVVSGRVRISAAGTPLIDIRPGGHFGELGLARPNNRSPSTKALTQTRLFTLTRDRFQELLRSKPELGARLAIALLDAVGDRIRDLSERLAAVQRAARGEIR